MLNRLIRLANSKCYWVFLIGLSISLLTVALLYQYVGDELPCVLCIHVRILLAGVLLLSLFVLALRKIYWVCTLVHGLVFMLMLWLLERSWMLLATERGFIEGSCDFSSGLPEWFALDKWFPLLFEIQSSCGYTPNLLFGITMAEALIVMSAILVLLSGVLTAIVIFRRSKNPL